MAYGFIRLEWQVPRRGYMLEERADLAQHDRTYLVPRGKDERSYTTNLLEHCIFLDVANTPPHDSEAILKVVNKWGLPSKGDWTIRRFSKFSLSLAKFAVLADDKGITRERTSSHQTGGTAS